MAALTEDRAKKLASSLARRVEAGETESHQFQDDLLKFYRYQEAQRAAGKKTREGKHSAKLAPLIAALPAEQRALGLHISDEAAGCRGPGRWLLARCPRTRQLTRK